MLTLLTWLENSWKNTVCAELTILFVLCHIIFFLSIKIQLSHTILNSGTPYLVFPGFTWSYLVLPGLTWCYLVLPGTSLRFLSLSSFFLSLSPYLSLSLSLSLSLCLSVSLSLSISISLSLSLYLSLCLSPFISM